MSEIPVRHNLSDNFTIREVSSLLADGDMVQPLHRHSYFYLLVLRQGKGDHRIDFVSYPVADGAVYFVRPGQVHELVLKAGTTGYLVEFSDAFYKSPDRIAFRRVTHKNYCLMTAGRFDKVWALLSDMLLEYTARQDRYQEAIRSYLDVLFVEILRQGRGLQDGSAINGEYRQERLEEFEELLAQHISSRKDVAYYAGALHLSGYQLNAITKALLGKTASEVITGHVVLEAKRQLLATPNLVNEVSWALGYEDVSYFIRFFKKQTGHSPEAFRRKFA